MGLLMLAGAAARAAEDRPQLWLYQSTNLWVDKNIDALETLWHRAAKAGYTHVMLNDSKFAKLGDMDRRYFANIDRVKKLARELNLSIVPGLFGIGYSNDLLWHDPNLAEGLPVKEALLVVKDNQATLLADPPVQLGPKFQFVDKTVTIAGATATIRDNPDNARFVYKLAVSPYRAYHVNVEIKTDRFNGEPRITVLGGKASLNYTGLGVKPTQDWKRHHIVFNSLDHREVSIYFGVWGKAKGSLQWRNWQIAEAGPVNLLRRDGTPLSIEIESGRALVEGKDFAPLIDPRMGNQPWKGSYEVWHEPPAIRTMGLADGTRLRASWYFPPIIHDEQVMICPSAPQTMTLLADQAQRMKQAFGASGYMMNHDEIRVLNQDESCRGRGLTPGEILADNVRRCRALLGPEATAFVWSDMFDPHHNAHDDYYLVPGDLAGSWNGIDPDVVIVNWNHDKRDAALKFFADRGNRQLIAAYYDGPLSQTRQWIDSAAGVKGVVGFMYTTWQSRYDELENFAHLVIGDR